MSLTKALVSNALQRKELFLYIAILVNSDIFICRCCMLPSVFLRPGRVKRRSSIRQTKLHLKHTHDKLDVCSN